MYANLVLYTEPKRPLINPLFDLFAWLDVRQEQTLVFPARVVDKIQLMVPEKCRELEKLPDDVLEFVGWQAKEKGYLLAYSLDDNWLYWSVFADTFVDLDMIKFL